MNRASRETVSSQQGPGLRPPRFGLKTLMWAIALFAALLTAYANFGSHVMAGLCLLALTILAHVAGNALGTQLRASGDASPRDKTTAGETMLPQRAVAADFAPAIDKILEIEGRVIVCGIGKSGHIGRKIAETLASTGTTSFFVHASEASHGDLGLIQKGV